MSTSPSHPRTRLVPLVASLLLALVSGGVVLLSSAPAQAASLCVDAAHRGDRSSAMENSLGSMRAAVARHADYLEMDAQVTKDGILTLMHDRTIDRTTNGTGRISDLTWAQLSRFRLDDGQRIPSLVSVLDLARASGTGVLIELKWIPQSRFAMLRRRILQFGVSRVVVNSFSPWVTSHFHASYPGIRSALDVNRPISVASAKAYGGVMPDYRYAGDTWLADLRAGGVPTYVWRVDTAAGWLHYRGKVTMVITDMSASYAAWRTGAC